MGPFILKINAWICRNVQCVMNYEYQRLFAIFLSENRGGEKKNPVERLQTAKQRSIGPVPPPPSSSSSSSFLLILLPGTLSWSKLQSGVIFLSVLPESRFVPYPASPVMSPSPAFTAREARRRRRRGRRTRTRRKWKKYKTKNKKTQNKAKIKQKQNETKNKTFEPFPNLFNPFSPSPSDHLLGTRCVWLFFQSPPHRLAVPLCALLWRQCLSTEPGGEKGDK